MLQKSKKASRLPDAYVPLAERPDYKAMLRNHAYLGRKIKKHTDLEGEINAVAQNISAYAQPYRILLIPSGKTHPLPDGGSLEWQMVGGRISCGRGNKLEDLVRVLKDPSINLGDCVETKEVPNEALLGERLKANPHLVDKIKEKLLGFSTGRSYEQFVIKFAGEEKRVKGEIGETFEVSKPEKR